MHIGQSEQHRLFRASDLNITHTYKCFLPIDIEIVRNIFQTNGHKWHVHQKPVKNDATSGCSSPGGHYNPFMVDVNVSKYFCFHETNAIVF